MHPCIILYYCQRCTCFEQFSAHHQELKSVHAASGICQTCLLLPLAWMTASQLIHASGNSKQVWHIPDAACTDLSSWWWAACTDLSSWWWAESPLETCRALTIIKSIIQRCILLVMLKNTLTMHGTMNVKFLCILHTAAPKTGNMCSGNPLSWRTMICQC
jgi:hypothetical protein